MNHHRNLSFRWIALAGLLFASVLTSDVSACPNCRDSLPSGKQTNGAAAEPKVAQGYAWSIYLMIGVPFAMVAGMGGAAFVLIRRASMNGK